MPPGSWCWVEEVGLTVCRFDPNAFLLSSGDVHGFRLAALDALQYGLSRGAKHGHCLAHGQGVTWQFIQ
jgi:hypothetical protein